MKRWKGPYREIAYMQKALELAALGRTSPNPMVGAVLVKEGQIVGKGYHRRAGEAHAEVEALRDAGPKARGSQLFVTLEPCCHYGRTPPCTLALIEAGVERVVAAMPDPNPKVAGRGLAQLEEAGLTVEFGLLEQEARKLNEVFVTYITEKRPFVTYKYAMTLDGLVATASGDSRWVSGDESRLEVHRLRDRVDAVMVGIGTVLADDPFLTARIPGGRSPTKVIVDSRGRTPLDARVLGPDAKTIIAVGPKAAEDRLIALGAAGAEVLQLPESEGGIDPAALLGELGRREISHVLLEGGPTLAASFLREGLVDKILAFVTPKIVGGKGSPGPVGDLMIDKMSGALPLRIDTVTRVGEDWLLTAYPKRGD